MARSAGAVPLLSSTLQPAGAMEFLPSLCEHRHLPSIGSADLSYTNRPACLLFILEHLSFSYSLLLLQWVSQEEEENLMLCGNNELQKVVTHFVKWHYHWGRGFFGFKSTSFTLNKVSLRLATADLVSESYKFRPHCLLS